MALSDGHVLFLVTLLAFIVHNGLALHLEANPKQFIPTINKQLSLTCTIDGMPMPKGRLFMLYICKEGSNRKIASVNSKGVINEGKSSPDIEASVTAEGRIKGNASQNYLTVTIQNPGMADAGTYSCIMTYLDEENHPQEEKALVNVIVDELDTLSYVFRKVQEQEKRLIEQGDLLQKQREMNLKHDKLLQEQRQVNSKQEKLLQEQDSKIKYQASKIKDHNSRMNVQDSKIKDREERDKHLNTSISECHSRVGDHATRLNDFMSRRDIKETYITAFSYGFNRKDTFKSGETLKFREKFVKVGDGYDPNTGVFTCPRDGLYVFHLSVKTHTDGYIQINLVLNNKIQSILWVWDKHHETQSSISTVVSAKAGDTVRPVVDWKRKEMNRIHGYRYFSIFSGYLLTLM